MKTNEIPSQAETACKIYRSAFLEVVGGCLTIDRHNSAAWHDAVAWGVNEGLFELISGENIEDSRISRYAPGRLAGAAYDYWRSMVSFASLGEFAIEMGF